MFAKSNEEQGHIHQYFSTGADLSFVLVRGSEIKKIIRSSMFYIKISLYNNVIFCQNDINVSQILEIIKFNFWF